MKKMMMITLRRMAVCLLLAALRPTTALYGADMDGFEHWTEFNSPAGNAHLESYVHDGWLGDTPPFLLPRAGFQMGPARIFRREGRTGRYALGIVTTSNQVNVLTECRAVTSSNRRTRPRVTVWLRGKGTVRIRIYAYDATPRAVDVPFIGTVIKATPEWCAYHALYEPDTTLIKSWGVVLEVGRNADIDIDDVSITTGTTTAAVYPPGSPTPVADSRRVAVAFPLHNEKILLDGQLDEAVWREAEWHGGFLQHQNQSLPTSVQAQFAFLYDDTHLYFAFASADPGPPTNTLTWTPHDTWPAGQPVELFLDPGASRDAYYLFVANVLGATCDYRRMERSWNCEWCAAGERDVNRWTLEAAIPFAAWGRTRPATGEVWAVNVCRNGAYSGPWAQVGPRYHSPEGFGVLTFGTYATWWPDGVLPEVTRQRQRLAAVSTDPALSRQLKLADALLARIKQAEEEKAPTEREGFLNWFRQGKKVRNLLNDVEREATWLQFLLCR